MDIEVIRRVGLARHLFELGSSNLRSQNDLHLFAAVNLVQDAVEAFLIGLADHLQVTFDQNTKFDKYFVLIDEKIAPKELPFKPKILRLNRVRIESKHHGIQPARDECERLTATAREFMDEVSSVHLGAPFATISAIDLLEESESKGHITAAKAALEEKHYEGCIVSCRKAIYVEIEAKYDISRFKDGDARAWFGAFSSAPYYARNQKYIAEHVHDPTDYIVLDHAHVDQELLKQGADPTCFWNIWRLTPEVYKMVEGTWLVKHDFGKLEPSTLGENAEYVFSSTVDLLLAIHTARRAVRWRNHNKYYIELAREGVPVYLKADRHSQVSHTTPERLTRLDTDYRIAGLNDEGPYWHVLHYEAGAFISGFIHNDEVRSRET